MNIKGFDSVISHILVLNHASTIASVKVNSILIHLLIKFSVVRSIFRLLATKCMNSSDIVK